ncbi:MAG TPA: GAF and ANTAR domain-containing protein [Jatrophihabitans sp.]|nr:GAF and ANTAR domain-containing protein [Jatrophihabitans sp.]
MSNDGVADRAAKSDPPPTLEAARAVDPGTPEPSVARVLSRLARRLQGEQDQDALLGAIADAAVFNVSGAEWAGISVRSDRAGLITRAATDPVVPAIDEAQLTLGEGPGLDAARRRHTIRSADLVAERRWPRFAPQALGLGVRSLLSLELFGARRRFGALNVYSGQPNAFDEPAEAAALLLAAHAALAIGAQQTRSTLSHALDIRDVVGQAKGILMERYRIGNQEAFELLSTSSQNTNRRLVEVADELIRTGQLPLP